MEATDTLIRSTVWTILMPMNRFPVLLWSALLLLLLLPTPAGRVLINLVGGVALVVLALPVVLAGLGWVGWKILQSRLTTCPACGAANLGGTERCAVCGSPLDGSKAGSTAANPSATFAQNADQGIPASEVTIDVMAQDPETDS